MADDATGLALNADKRSRLADSLGGEGVHFVPAGRMAYTVAMSGSMTFEYVAELPCRWDDIGTVIPVIAQSRAGSPGAPPLLRATTAPIASLASLDAAWPAANAVQHSWDRNSSLSLANLPLAADSSRRQYIFPDPVAVTPTARDDGGTRALVATRVYMTQSTVQLLGSSVANDSFDNWVSRAAGLARYRVNSVAGDQTANNANWGLAPHCPVIGFIYTTSRKTVQVYQFGDSNGDGRGPYTGAGFGLRAVEKLNAAGLGVQFSFVNGSWSGQSSDKFEQHLLDSVSFGLIPDVLLYCPATVNDTDPSPSGVITQANFNLWRQRAATAAAICNRHGIRFIPYTLMPTGPIIRPGWGATDHYRRDFNAELLARYPTAQDIDAVVAGPIVSGQGTFVAGASGDDVHITNPIYIDLCGDVMARGIAKAAGVTYGS